MAHFDGSFGHDLRMLELDFLDLVASSLESPDVTLGGTTIHRGSVDSSSREVRENYWGSFSYTHDPSGNLVVQGQVTDYSRYVYAWDGDDRYLANGFEIRDLSLDVAELVGLTDVQVLVRMLAGADRIEATQSDDHVAGFGGDDELYGYGGADTLDGGAGADIMYGGQDADVYAVNHAGDVVHEFDFDSLGRDTVNSSLDFHLPPRLENLVLVGDAGRGWGNALANMVEGNAGANILRGGNASDTLSGGNGEDRLQGGDGADLLAGGAGRDTFFYKSAAESMPGDSDRITDFAPGRDLIGLRGVDANVGLAGNQQFTFIGRAAFDRGAAAGQLRFVYDSENDMGTLLGSSDADRSAEFVVQLPGVSRVVLDDLVL